MTRVKEFLRIMWWRHGIGGRRRLTREVFALGFHAGYHAERPDGLGPCDERCARILADA